MTSFKSFTDQSKVLMNEMNSKKSVVNCGKKWFKTFNQNYRKYFRKIRVNSKRKETEVSLLIKKKGALQKRLKK